MGLAHSKAVKEYEAASWPGCDVVLLEEQGYLDLLTSHDDGGHYTSFRVKSVEEADRKAAEFFAHLEGPYCMECGGCRCDRTNCMIPLADRCRCK